MGPKTCFYLIWLKLGVVEHFYAKFSQIRWNSIFGPILGVLGPLWPPLVSEKTLKSGIYGSQSSCGATMLLPTKFQPNRMEIEFWSNFWDFHPLCAPFGGQKIIKSGNWGSQSSCGAKTLLPTKFQPNRMKINLWSHFWDFRPLCAPFGGQKTLKWGN